MVSKDRYVRDASALLCVLFDEPGAEFVASRLTGAIVSATSYAEVIASLVDRGTPAEEIVAILSDLDIDVMPVDRHQAEIASLMRPIRPNTSAADLALGSRACLPLALTRPATVVTTDRSWREMPLEVDVELAR